MIGHRNGQFENFCVLSSFSADISLGHVLMHTCLKADQSSEGFDYLQHVWEKKFIGNKIQNFYDENTPAVPFLCGHFLPCVTR